MKFFLLSLIIIIFTAFIISYVLKKPTITRFNVYLAQSQKLTYSQGSRRANYLLQPPVNYDKDKSYPLVIALHGWSESGDSFFIPVISDQKEQMEKYPCFFLAPNNNTKGWSDKADWARKLIMDLVTNYSIDKSRIYIIGFSMGGSGSFLFADALFQDYGIITAAIVRLAGESQTGLVKELQDSTAVWYHVGTTDTNARTKTANDFYVNHENAKLYDSHESVTDTAAGFKRTTDIFFKNNRAFIKYSRYENMGHTADPVSMDLSIMDWLFTQKVEVSSVKM